MTYYPRLYIKNEFEIVEAFGEVSAVSVGGDNNDYNGVVLLKNDSARFMFEKLREGITLPELIKACMDEYQDSPVEEVGPSVIAFLDELKAKGILAVDTTRGVKFGDSND